VSFQDTDIAPYHVQFTIEAHRKYAEYSGDEGFEARIGNHLAELSHRNIASWAEVEPGHWQDEWGVVWNRTVDKDIGVVANRILPQPTLRGWSPPEPNPPLRVSAYPDFIKQNQDRFLVATMGFLLFERAWTLRGMDAILMDMIESPGFVHSLLDAITEYYLAQVELAVSQDIDAVRFGDDWGSQRGLIMGPALWREFIKPRLARLFGAVRGAGKCAMIHSCGDVREVLPDLIECGLNVFNPFQPEVMDVYETKKRYYGKLSFYGGISVQRLLPRGTPDEVRQETRRLVRELGRGGGYIAAPSHAIPRMSLRRTSRRCSRCYRARRVLDC